MRVREAKPEDWTAIWPFFREIVTAGETYAYPPDLDEAGGRDLWMVGPPGRVTVAICDQGAVIGSASMYPNRPGRARTWPARASWSIPRAAARAPAARSART